MPIAGDEMAATEMMMRNEVMMTMKTDSFYEEEAMAKLDGGAEGGAMLTVPEKHELNADSVEIEMEDIENAIAEIERGSDDLDGLGHDRDDDTK